ncbi:SGNH/GDSL hydrolase family protein [Chitinophaga deserti]|uniref:SGNH/GDSL hydrolase family protein n=1 Tax=Chitinophaga deserti TaxID=2164099 RepID=UPI000D6B322E|nr:SGNH/GDSL hydrolase family protein [Chitinophaga deserti]
MRHLRNCISILLCASVTGTQAQSNSDLIAASQAGASPLYFQPIPATPLVTPGSYKNEGECVPRNGLPAFFGKAKAGKPLLVGFIGGSITQGNAGYRPQALRYLQGMFPASDIKALNAGVSGTGTDLGACRVQEQLLQYKPDLVFIEFAVNGAYAEGMEGIVRQVKAAGAEACLIYTITGTQTKDYNNGKIPLPVQGLERVAEHYQLPSVHLGMEASQLELDGKLLWKGDPKDTVGHILFSTDGVHPLQAGGNLYAAAIARAMEEMKRMSSRKPVRLPKPLFTDNWESAGMYAPRDIAVFTGSWEQVKMPQFAPWFPVIEKASVPGAAFTFRFRGSGFGIFDIGGPEVGQITIEVNGRPMQVQPPLVPGTQVYRLQEGDSLPVNRFNAYCYNRYRGQHQLFSLPDGEYTVTIRLSSQLADKRSILGRDQQTDIAQHPEKYSATVLYLGRVLLKGTPLPMAKQ